jgi:hypothetical protein
MPYIKSEDREKFEEPIQLVFNALFNNKEKKIQPGELNYLISSIIWDAFNENLSYRNANELMGVLECVKQEFYRRQVAVLEDQKIIENGDIT